MRCVGGRNVASLSSFAKAFGPPASTAHAKVRPNATASSRRLFMFMLSSPILPRAWCARAFCLQVLSEHASGSQCSISGFNKAASCDARCVTRLLFCPIVRRRLRILELICVLVAARHRSGGAAQHFVMVDIKQAQPALLAERQSDHAAKL